MPAVDLLIFDLDGTLIDSKRDIARSIDPVLVPNIVHKTIFIETNIAAVFIFGPSLCATAGGPSLTPSFVVVSMTQSHLAERFRILPLNNPISPPLQKEFHVYLDLRVS